MNRCAARPWHEGERPTTFRVTEHAWIEWANSGRIRILAALVSRLTGVYQQDSSSKQPRSCGTLFTRVDTSPSIPTFRLDRRVGGRRSRPQACPAPFTCTNSSLFAPARRCAAAPKRSSHVSECDLPWLPRQLLLERHIGCPASEAPLCCARLRPTGLNHHQRASTHIECP